MNADMLMSKVVAYGADEEGLRDRFDGNNELYASCFDDFLKEPSFTALDEAIKAEDYPRAFDAAHALKGLSGNLGLVPFYDVICVLVETLRAHNYADAAKDYESVRHQLSNLLSIASDEEPSPAAPQQEPGAEGAEQGGTSKKKHDRFVPAYIAFTLVLFTLIGMMFSRLRTDYENNVVSESGGHLIEMSNQIKLYVEEKVANDWRIALSVGDGIANSGHEGDDEAMMEILMRMRAVWGVTDLVLYTEDGYCVNINGETDTNDVASELIVRAREHGRYLSIVDSGIIYTVPIETEQQFRGSRIAAVSVVQDMKTFLDDMNFSSFDNNACLYLTNENGIIISMLSSDTAVQAFSIKAVVGDAKVEALNPDASPEDIFKVSVNSAYLTSNGEGKGDYVVSAAINTGSTPLHLYYLTPEAVVNSTLSSFSSRITNLTVVMVLLFAALMLISFIVMFKSRKKLFDKELLAREKMFDLLVKNTKTAFALYNVNEPEPSYVSSNMAKVVGDRYWSLERKGRGYRMRNNTDTETSVIASANEKLRWWDGKGVFESGYILNDRAAEPSWFTYRLYPTDDKGSDFVGIMQDMTLVYEREQTTKKAMELATSANEAKTAFLSKMSHDIRTPMNAIMNMTNFALECIDRPKKLGPYLRTIKESSEHLLHLINEVLDMSRIESGRAVLDLKACDLKAVIQKQAEMIRSLSDEKGQTLITDLEGLNDTRVLADELKLSQIVMNLLSNAVKFTPEKGAIRFTAAEIPSLRENVVDVRFTVEDNGIGISEQSLASIFDPFFRASDERVGAAEGTGLGLSICKAYVDAMGGEIRCESEEGEGSIFTVELFFQRVGEEFEESRAELKSDETTYLGLRCLVAEDNYANQLIAEAMLERLGFIVDFANDGAECVAEFEASESGTYDIIYMDIRMPALDGYQATSRIRQGSHPQAKTIPIVAMTANVFAEDIERARIAGMDAYVGKPIVSFDLIEQTNKALSIKRGK